MASAQTEYKRDLERFAQAMRREFGDSLLVANACKQLTREANIHARLMVDACNGPSEALQRVPGFTWDAWSEKREKDESACEARIRAACDAIGASVYFSGDPRGLTVHIRMPKTRAYNTWGGEESGYCPPVRPYVG